MALRLFRLGQDVVAPIIKRVSIPRRFPWETSKMLHNYFPHLQMILIGFYFFVLHVRRAADPYRRSSCSTRTRYNVRSRRSPRLSMEVVTR